VLPELSPGGASPNRYLVAVGIPYAADPPTDRFILENGTAILGVFDLRWK
jgi:hypothetical protein